jgi:anti-sigma regulatory factor (Ser/Thr protein kinase)
MGFFKKIEQNNLAHLDFDHSYVGSYDQSGVLQELFWLSQRDEIQRVFSRCGKILLNQGFQDDMVSWVTYIVGELCDNVFNHAAIPGENLQGAFTCIQSYQKKSQVQICVADFGKGIRSALNESSKYDFSNDQDAIIEALKPGVSGHETVQERRGNGLTDVLTIARKSGSNFDIRSGCGRLFTRCGHIRQNQNNGMLEGTLIGFDLSADNISGVPVNLNELRSETNDVLDGI